MTTLLARARAHTPVFYGWRIVGYAAVCLAMTAPGQTVGVSVFVDPMIETLAVSRSQLSGAYLAGTLIGAASLPTVGRWLDRAGIRRVTALVAAAFGAALAGMAGVGGLASLLIGFVGIRMLGQGALTLTATTSVTPVVRTAPGHCRRAGERDRTSAHVPRSPRTRRRHRRLAFHQISLLGERGLTPAQAAANFIPQTLAAIAGTLVMGWLVDRVAPRLLVACSMLALAAAMLLAQTAAPGWRAVAFGVAAGAASGTIRTLEAAAFPRFFGLAHIGAIRGLVMAVAVMATAFGPLTLAVGYERFGTYAVPLNILLAVPAAVSVAALFVRHQVKRPSTSPERNRAAIRPPMRPRRRPKVRPGPSDRGPHRCLQG